MLNQPGEAAAADEFPQVESTLFAGLARARKLDQDPEIVLDAAEAGSFSHAEPAGSAATNRRRYVPQGEIGRGGMGAVYRVLDTDLNRTLALKVALRAREDESTRDSDGDLSLLERFLEEAQVTGQLDHPGVVPLHELGIDSSGCVYFTMRMVRGRHLGEVFELARRGEEDWNTERVLIALVRVAEAVAYAHAKGVVHRDLKPANVMAGRFGEVYVMDWGLAKVRGRPDRPRPTSERTLSVVRSRRDDEASGDVFRTSRGTVFGTPAYMSPEQARGDVEAIDARSDVYSLGAILYHFLTGSAPYLHSGARLDVHVVLKWLLDGPPEAVRKLAPSVAPELAAICAKAMARDPAQRYSDMQALAEDLRAFLVGRPVSALPLGPFVRIGRWCRKNPVAAAMLVAITAGSAYGLWRLESLGTDLVRNAALDSTAMKADILKDVNGLYSAAVAGRVDKTHVEVTHDYAQRAGAIPLPATFLNDLGERISAHSSGVRVRQYSDYPFRFRGPSQLDDFGRHALDDLRVKPEQAVYAFEEIGGRPVLRYAIGRRMEASCVTCHNAHPDSTKTDWKEGDVRGVLEIVRPLDQDVARVQAGLRGTLLAVASIVGGLLLVSVFGIVRSAVRRGDAGRI